MAEGFGLFGKVPSKGDFVTDNLHAEFVQPWDGWLQQTLLLGRDRLGDRWRECFLSNPVWRFVLGPGTCGPQAVTGVLASSIDGVGRIYPLTIAAPLGPAVNPWVLISTWSHGYEKLTDLALEMVRDKAGFDHATTRLRNVAAALPIPADALRAPPGSPEQPLYPGESGRVALDDPAAQRLVATALGQAGTAFSLFWLEGWGLAPFAIIGNGLPDPAGSLTLWEAAAP